jgi:O-methyltransferase involved in polyketide biosynthesis
MADEPITHVSDTAFWVATYRADEAARPDALFADPLAAKLVEGRGRAIAAQMVDTAMLQWIIPLRTRMIDDFVAAAIAEGCDAVVNLGAGLDTRPYRLALPPSRSRSRRSGWQARRRAARSAAWPAICRTRRSGARSSMRSPRRRRRFL